MKLLCYVAAMASLLAGGSLLAAADSKLINAVRDGDDAALRGILQRGADANSSSADGTTALAWAAQRNSLPAVEMLIKAGAKVNTANEYGVTPLHMACLNGSPAIVNALLAHGADANSALPSGESVLMTASRTGNREVVQLLLDHRVKIDHKESLRGQTALMWAIAANHAGVSELLIKRKANVGLPSKSGFTALMFAAQQSNQVIAQQLLDAGARINDSTPEDGGALTIAVLSGHESLARFLLAKGANPNLATSHGITPLHYAILQGLSLGAGVERYATWSHLAHLFRPNMTGLVRELLARGADPNARISSAPPLPATRRLPVITVIGATPYILAAASYDTELMRILVDAGADPKAVTAEGSDALTFAAGLAAGLGHLPPRTEQEDKNALAAVRLAVELGADVKHANKFGNTALHGAAYVGSDAIVKFLVEKGARVNAKDEAGQTPLTIASMLFPPTLLDDNLRPQWVHETTAKLLIDLGATLPKQ